MTQRLYTFSLLFLVLILGACSSRTTIESDMGLSDAPDWVNEGTQAVKDDDGRLIHGVGLAPPMGDVSLQKSTADNRARTEIARVLSTYVDAVIKDYTASTGSDADLNVEREIRSTTQLALSGVRILGHWKNEENGDVYAFAELDMDAVEETLETATSLVMLLRITIKKTPMLILTVSWRLNNNENLLGGNIIKFTHGRLQYAGHPYGCR